LLFLKTRFKFSKKALLSVAFLAELLAMIASIIAGLLLNDKIDDGTIESWSVVLLGSLCGASMGFQCVAARESFANCPPTTVMTNTLINVPIL